MVDVAEVQNAPILAINSGPSMAPIAGRGSPAEAPGRTSLYSTPAAPPSMSL